MTYFLGYNAFFCPIFSQGNLTEVLLLSECVKAFPLPCSGRLSNKPISEGGSNSAFFFLYPLPPLKPNSLPPKTQERNIEIDLSVEFLQPCFFSLHTQQHLFSSPNTGLQSLSDTGSSSSIHIFLSSLPDPQILDLDLFPWSDPSSPGTTVISGPLSATSPYFQNKAEEHEMLVFLTSFLWTCLVHQAS